MPSRSGMELKNRLRDVDEILAAHRRLTGGKAGKPAAEQGRALTRAGVVLLAAAMEAYLEDLFEEAAQLLMPDRTAAELMELFKSTSRRMNNADTTKTELLFFNLGIPWALEGIKWQKFSNEKFRKSVNQLVNARNAIAHGKRPGVQVRTLRAWHAMVTRYSDKFDGIVDGHISSKTGTSPGWS